MKLSSETKKLEIHSNTAYAAWLSGRRRAKRKNEQVLAVFQ